MPGFAVSRARASGRGARAAARGGRACSIPVSAYLRLSAQANREALPLWPGLQVVRSGRKAVVVAVGPMLSPVLDAVGDLDVTVAYATTVRPFDGEGLRALAAAAADTVVLVEPYLAGTSAHVASEALAGRAHRLLSVGVPRTELRRYGQPADHDAVFGLDAAGIRRSVSGFVFADLT